MFEKLFFGTYLGFTLAGAILINDIGKSIWGAAWFVLLCGIVLM